MHELHKVKITILRRFHPSEVFERSPVTHVDPIDVCGMFRDGQEFIVEDLRMPEGFCTNAWVSMYGNIQLLSFGGDFPLIKEKGAIVLCCIDGLRPVIFKLERI